MINCYFNGSKWNLWKGSINLIEICRWINNLRVTSHFPITRISLLYHCVSSTRCLALINSLFSLNTKFCQTFTQILLVFVHCAIDGFIILRGSIDCLEFFYCFSCILLDGPLESESERSGANYQKCYSFSISPKHFNLSLLPRWLPFFTSLYRFSSKMANYFINEFEH